MTTEVASAKKLWSKISRNQVVRSPTQPQAAERSRDRISVMPELRSSKSYYDLGFPS